MEAGEQGGRGAGGDGIKQMPFNSIYIGCISYLQKYFFPIPYFLFPIPYSLFPVACCLFPVPCSLFPFIN